MSSLAERLDGMSPKRLALVALELEAQLKAAQDARHEPLAIVGMACRLPGAPSLDAFWSLLHEGRSAIADVPPDRWDVDALYDPDPDHPGTVATRWGGFLDDIRGFDAAFFGIAPREAVTMDPQQRLLLETAWQALEHAGLSPDRLGGSLAGVFNGICNNDFHQLLLTRPATQIDAYSASGSAFSVAAGRLSYFLGLEGPSLSVDTACSSSLVALHLACQSLRNGESDIALASGVNVLCNAETTIALSRSHMMAPDGRCKTFDAAADGFVRGEGCGVVVLKRLSRALADGDRVLALVRGSAVNQDGRSSGLTAPNGPSQEAVIRGALRNACVEAEAIDYVEAHGTGTSLGDPIELRALGAVLAPGGRRTRPVAIGSVKTNIGHLEAAAGMAGLLKVILSFLHEVIPAHLHFQTPNPHVDWDVLPFEIPVTARPWPRGSRPRLAGLSSFGFSGTNVHIVLEEAPTAPGRPAPDPGVQLLPVSARTATALSILQAHTGCAVAHAPALRDVAHTLGAGRAHLAHRLAVVADSTAVAATLFEAGAAGPDVLRGEVEPGPEPDVAFLYTGQGAQYPGMARGLYETEPVFREAIDRCAAALAPDLGTPLTALLWEDAGARLDDTGNTQPAIFALQYALTCLWASWGIRPGAVLGHSVGELAACCAAGVFGVEDGLRLVAARGRLMQQLPRGGGMVAVFADERVVATALAGAGLPGVAIAAVNGPANTVVSGPLDQIQTVARRLAADGIRSADLHVSHAFHSHLMEPALDGLEAAAATIAFADPAVPVVSNVTGHVVSGDLLRRPDYWRRHARQPVRFADGIAAVQALGCRIFLEIGPHPTLVGMARQALSDEGLTWLASLRRGTDDRRQMLRSLGALYVAGTPVDWCAVTKPHAPRIVSLPTYPFEHTPYWPDGLGTRTPARPGGGAANAPWLDWLYELAWIEDARADAPVARALAAMRDAVIAGSAPALARHGAAVYDELYPALDCLAASYIVQAIRTLGWHPAPGEEVDAPALRSRLGVKPVHERLFARMLEILGEDGFLARTAEGWRVVAVPPAEDPEALADTLLARLPACRAELTLTRRCAAGLAAVLTGSQDPMQLLFPDGSLEQTEALYERAPVFRVFNSLVADAVRTLVEGRPEPDRLRILEIGAGTGSTSASVLPVLPASRTDYVFTDVSPAFLTRAEQKFAAFPFVRYRTLDVERDPLLQGFDEGSFDLIVASNVLHATPVLDETLARVRTLLARGGVLLLLEGTRPQRFGDLTVGLTDGWWKYADQQRTYALMGADSWLPLLERCGFTDATAVPGASAASAAIFANQAIILARAAERPAPRRSVLILDDAQGRGAEVAAALREQGHDCWVAHAGETGAPAGAWDFSVRPSVPDDARRLLEHTVGSTPGAWTLVAMSGAGLATVEKMTEPSAALADACQLFLHTIQAALASGRPPERTLLATAGAQAVAGTAPQPLQSVLWGLLRSLDLEHPELRCAAIDLDPADAVAPSLTAELLQSLDEGETQVAWRGGTRLVARIKRIGAAVAPLTLGRLDGAASYLVTGGLAGLGLAVAGRLVDRGARRLVLTGRRAPAPEAERTIGDWRDRGVEVVVARGDVAVRQTVADVVAAIPADRPLRGIVHCAGMTRDAAVEQQSWETLREVFRAKIDGTWHLHQASRGCPLDFFVLFSSGASVLGSPGQTNHGAANAFLDGLAEWRRAAGLPASSINWGAWSGIGAAVRGTVLARVQELGLDAIDPASGLAAFEHLVAAGRSQAAVLPVRWSELIPTRPAHGRRLFDAVVEDVRSCAAPTTAPAARPAASQRADVARLDTGQLPPFFQALVGREAGRILGLAQDALDPRRPLQELGLDSLMAVELRNTLAAQVERQLPSTLLFNYPSVHDLAAHLTALESSSRTPDTAPAAAAVRGLEALDDLSEAELAGLLAAKLNELG